MKIALGLAVLGLVLAFVPEDLGQRVSIALIRLRGYDGCLCGDCARAFGFVAPRYGCCGSTGGLVMGGQVLAVLSWMVSGVVLLMAIAPGAAGSRFGRGCCEGCGYDLAGLPEGVPCPECGGVIGGERS